MSKTNRRTPDDEDYYCAAVEYPTGTPWYMNGKFHQGPSRNKDYDPLKSHLAWLATIDDEDWESEDTE